MTRQDACQRLGSAFNLAGSVLQTGAAGVGNALALMLPGSDDAGPNISVSVDARLAAGTNLSEAEIESIVTGLEQQIQDLQSRVSESEVVADSRDWHELCL